MTGGEGSKIRAAADPWIFYALVMSTSVAVTTYRHSGIPREVASRVRETMRDEFGNELFVWEHEAGAPCRQCLRISRPGEPLILFAYRPFETHNPYAEVGPVFIHAHACETYADQEQFPADFAARTLTLRAYDERGWIVDGVVATPEAREAALARLFALDGVRFVHVRNPGWGCYDFRIERG